MLVKQATVSIASAVLNCREDVLQDALNFLTDRGECYPCGQVLTVSGYEIAYPIGAIRAAVEYGVKFLNLHQQCLARISRL